MVLNRREGTAIVEGLSWPSTFLLALTALPDLPAMAADHGEMATWGVSGLLLGIAATLAAAWAIRHRALRRLSARARRQALDLLDSSPTPAFLHRQGLLLHANPAFLALFGLHGLAELDVRRAIDLVAPDERERVGGYIAARIHGEFAPEGYETRCIRMGETFPVEVKVEDVNLPDGPGHVVFLQDISERVEAREALQEVEEDYRGLFHNAHDAILVVDADRRVILDANRAACELYGYPRAGLLGLPLENISGRPGQAAERIRKTIEMGAVLHVDAVHKMSDGSDLFVDINSSIVHYQGRKAVLSIIRDTTERRRAQEVLRQSEENYRLLIENQTDIVVKLNRDGKITFVSPSFCRAAGQDLGTIVGSDVLPFVHEEDLQETMRTLALLRKPPHVSQIEHRLRMKDGWRWFACSYAAVLDGEGKVTSLVGTGHDVTGRRATEAALAESEQLFRALAESAAAAIVIYQESALLYANPAAEKITGFSNAELNGMTLGDLLHPEYRELIKRRAMSRLRGEPVLSQFEAPIRKKDGSTRWLLVSLAQASFRGERAGVLTAFDVTAHKEAEDQLRQSAYQIQAIFNALPDLFFRLDAEGLILDWKASKAEELFLPPEQILGRKVQDLLPPAAARSIYNALLEANSTRRTCIAEYSLSMPKGETLYEARIAPLSDGQAVAVVRNVTERHTAERELKASEEKFRAIIQASPIGMHTYRLEPDGRLVFMGANPTADRLLGFEHARLVGKTIEEAFPGLAETQLPERCRQVCRDGTPWQMGQLDYEDDRIRGSFEVHAFQTAANAVGVMFSDVTEKARLAAEIAGWRQRFELVTAASGQVIYEYAIGTGRILWSGSLEKVLGYTTEDMGGIGEWLERIHANDRPEAERLLDVSEKSMTPYDAEYRFRHRDGHYLFIHDHGFFIADGNGRAERMVGMMEDLSARRAAEEELRQALRRLGDEVAKSEAILTCIGDGISIQDLDMRVIYQNDVQRGLTGDQTGKFCYQAYECRERVCDECPIAKSFQDGLIHTAERTLDKGGDRRYFEITSSPLRDATGAIVGGIESVRDITARRRGEAALRESETKYRTLMDSANDAIFIADAETGMILDANRRAQELVGRTIEELRAMHQTQLHPQAEQERYAGIFSDHVDRGKGLSEPVVVRHRDGRLIPVEISASIIDISGQKVVLGIFRDVAERSRAAADLQQSEEKFRRIFDLSPVGSAMVGLDRRFIRCNDAYCRFLGYTEKELAEKTFQDVTYPEDREVGLTKIHALASGEIEVAQFQKRYLRKDGAVVWGEITVRTVPDARGHTSHFLTIVQDITERKKAADALAENERRLRTILEKSPISMALVALDGTIEYINRKAIETFGYVPEDIPTMDRWWALAYSDEAYRKEVISTYTGLVERAIAENREVEGREYRVTCKDGTVKTMWIFGVPVGGKVFVMFHDMTERWLAEEALRARLEQHRALVENARAIILQFDPDLTITFWNDYATEFFGFTRDEALGASLLDTVVPRTDTAGRDLEAMIRDIAGDVNRYASNINENMTKDGRRVWVAWSNRPMVDEHGAFAGILSIGTDITDLKMAEEALRASEVKYRRLYEGMRDGFVVVTLEGRITGCNEAFCTLTGYSREELVLLTYMDLTPEKWHEMERRHLEEEILPSGASVLYEKEYRRKDGSLVPIEVRAQAERDEDGTPLFMWAVVRDITERKRTLDELALRHRQLLSVAASAEAMASFRDTATATKAICEAAVRAFGATMAWIGLVVPETTELTPLVSAGRDEGYTAQVKVTWDLSHRAMGPTGRSITTRLPQVMSVDDPAFAPWRQAALKRGYRSVCALPLINGDEVRGAVTLYSEDPNAFGPENMDIFEIFARQCTMVLVNASLYEEAQRTISELWAAKHAEDGDPEVPTT